MEHVRAGCAILIALVFLVSAVSKLRDLGGFGASVAALAQVGPGLVRPLSMVVVIGEAAVPVLLVIPPLTPYGFLLAGSLLAAFSAAIAAAMARGRRSPCRCFGASSTPVGPRHLVRNAVLLAAAALGWAGPGGLPPAPGMAMAAAAGLTGAILLVSLDDIIDLFARNS